MWLTRLFVARPTLVTVFLALVLLAGSIGGASLVQQQAELRQMRGGALD